MEIRCGVGGGGNQEGAPEGDTNHLSMWGKVAKPMRELGMRGMRREADRDCFLRVSWCIFIDRYGLLLSRTVDRGDRLS